MNEMKRPFLSILAALGLLWIVPVHADEPLSVFVSVPPQAYIAERIGGEHVAVEVLVRPGQEPHTFEPTPKQILALSRAKLFLRIGIPFETRLLEKIQASHPDLKVVDTTKGIEKRRLTVNELSHDEHSADQEEHHEGEPDLHVWMAPPLVEILAQNTAGAFTEVDPSHAEKYEQNFQAFLKDVRAVHEKIKRNLLPFKGRSFYVFHPAFGYFADTYGLRQEAVEIQGKSPSPRQLSDLIRKAKAENVKVIFVQPQFDKRGAEVVADAIGGVVLPLDPLAKDLLKNFEEIAVKIEHTLKE